MGLLEILESGQCYHDEWWRVRWEKSIGPHQAGPTGDIFSSGEGPKLDLQLLGERPAL